MNTFQKIPYCGVNLQESGVLIKPCERLPGARSTTTTGRWCEHCLQICSLLTGLRMPLPLQESETPHLFKGDMYSCV